MVYTRDLRMPILKVTASLIKPSRDPSTPGGGGGEKWVKITSQGLTTQIHSRISL